MPKGWGTKSEGVGGGGSGGGGGGDRWHRSFVFLDYEKDSWLPLDVYKSMYNFPIQGCETTKYNFINILPITSLLQGKSKIPSGLAWQHTMKTLRICNH